MVIAMACVVVVATVAVVQRIESYVYEGEGAATIAVVIAAVVVTLDVYRTRGVEVLVDVALFTSAKGISLWGAFG